jgi:hypothetical protein
VALTERVLVFPRSHIEIRPDREHAHGAERAIDLFASAGEYTVNRWNRRILVAGRKAGSLD